MERSQLTGENHDDEKQSSEYYISQVIFENVGLQTATFWRRRIVGDLQRNINWRGTVRSLYTCLSKTILQGTVRGGERTLVMKRWEGNERERGSSGVALSHSREWRSVQEADCKMYVYRLKGSHSVDHHHPRLHQSTFSAFDV